MQDLLRTTARILTFRASGEELSRLGPRHLAFGLFCTWLVGIGRWWDDPGADPLLHLGLGSVAYVFILSTFLFLIIWPLRPKNWRWLGVVTFVSLTSPPAMLYAIPVERLADLKTATSLNVWALGVVATWRVGLLLIYLKRSAGLALHTVFVGTMLPLMLIVTALTTLNLERAVFEFMAGLRDSPPPTPHDGAYELLLVMTLLSYVGVVPLLIWYTAEIIAAHTKPEPSQRSTRVE